MDERRRTNSYQTIQTIQQQCVNNEKILYFPTNRHADTVAASHATTDQTPNNIEMNERQQQQQQKR